MKRVDIHTRTQKGKMAATALVLLLLSKLLISSAWAADSDITVSFATSQGDFTVELYPDKAPATVANFVNYANDGFYTGTIFHRVVSDFVVQGGGFEPGMSKKQTKAPVLNESLNGLPNERGSLAMARQRDPHSATAQFFVNLVDNDDLNPRGTQFGYTVFGKVISGLDVVDKISKVSTKDRPLFKNVPVEDVLIKSATPSKAALAAAVAYAKNSAKGKQYIAGKHYTVLGEPVPVEVEGKNEVVEVFSYGCQHCYTFEGPLGSWVIAQGDKIQFRRSPAIWNGLMRLFAHAHYTLMTDMKAPAMHKLLFEQVVLDGRPMLSEAMIGEFFTQNGWTEQRFAEIFDSKEVIAKVAVAEERVANYQIEDIPALIVNGKYRVSAKLAGSQDAMIEIVEQLLKEDS